MRLTFLGTGAADWVEPVGGEFRAYTSTRLDSALLIDGTMRALERISDPDAITDILYTHSHRDHFDARLLERLAPVRVHAHAGWAGTIDVPGVTVCPFETFAPFEAAGFAITPLPSNHTPGHPGEQTVHYIIKKGEKTLFYALDGAWLLYEEWNALKDESLDAVVFDATIGEGYPGDYRIFEHNSIEMLRIMVQTMRRPMFGKSSAHGAISPVLKEGAPVFLTHLARTLNPTQAELERQLAGEFIPAYDGMEVTI